MGSLIINIYCIFRVEPGTTFHDEPKFIVFYSAFLSLFNMFCFNCKSDSPRVTMKRNGTLVTVQQECRNCKHGFTWRSQPLLRGHFPAGNLLLSFAILMAGASISKIHLVFKHLGLQVYKVRTYFYHQSSYLFPSIQKYWKSYRASLIVSLKAKDNLTWSGDGRFDSMGHSAKFGAYSMMCHENTKIVHFELLQVNGQPHSQALVS
jgi:solute carrier family 8 (sodium/calcium exchanger)